MRPLAPGADWEGCRVEQVLAWGHRGGLYRVRRADGLHILKEIYLPALPQAELVVRREEVSRGLEDWRRLQPPHTLPIQDVVWQDNRVYLLLPELPECQTSRQPPDSGQVVLWAQQLAGLVIALQRTEHPLALQILQPDHVVRSADEQVIVVNPGWSELAWRGAAELRKVPAREGLHRYGELLSRLASSGQEGGLTATLSPALLWIVGRCLTSNPAQEFVSFREVELSLSRLPVKHAQPAFSSREALEHFPVLPAPVSPARVWWNPRVLGFCVIVCLLSLFAAGRQAPHRGSRPVALVLGQGRQLLYLAENGEVQRQVRLSSPVQSLAEHGGTLYAACNGSRGLTRLRGRDKPSVLGLVDVPGRLRYDAEVGVLCMSESGRVAAVRGEVLQWSLNLRPGIRDARMADASSLLLLTSEDVSKVQVATGETRAIWKHAGLRSLSLLAHRVLASSASGVLYSLDRDLREVVSSPLPGGAGTTTIYENSYSPQFWAVHESGLVSTWSAAEVRLLEQLRLPGSVVCATPDPLGRLWVLCSDDTVNLVYSGPLRSTHVARLDAREARDLIYLPGTSWND